MDLLGQALSGGGDPEKCIEIIAKNFPDFCENDILLNFPIEVLIGIFSHKDFHFPDNEKTSNFFVRLFDRGPEYAQCFSDFVPFETLDLTSLFMIAKKLKSMNLDCESRRFSRIIKMKNKLDQIEKRRENDLKQLTTVAQNLQGLDKYLSQAQLDLKGTTAVLNLTVEQIQNRNKTIDELRQQYIDIQNAIIMQQV